MFPEIKNKGLKSVEGTGHALGPLCPILLSGNRLFKNFLSATRKYGGSPS
jgi:hypothetical protein